MVAQTSSRYSGDAGLTARIIISFAILTLLYLVFAYVLLFVGVGFIPMAVITSLMILAQWYFSDRIVLWSAGAKVVTKEQYPALHEIVERVSARSNLVKPKVAVIKSNMANAFATGKSQKSSLVAVTTGLMEILDQEELEGVIAHELSHIKNRDVLVLTLASIFSTVAFYIMYSSMFSVGGRSRGNGGAGILIVLLVAFITWLISFLIIRAISRYREYAADRGAAQVTGKPRMLASALQKISGSMKKLPPQAQQRVEGLNAFFIIPAMSGSSLGHLFSTHPPVEKRIEKLMQMDAMLME